MSLPHSLPDNVHFYNSGDPVSDDHDELLQGLSARPRRVNPKWFYDAAGSALFEQITEQPEYYVTRTEVAILEANREAISECCGSGCVLIEPGCGSCEKVRLLLDSLRPAAYVPLDISAQFLQQSAAALGREYPWLQVHAVCADFNNGWAFPGDLPPGRRVVFYPGSTIGNLDPEAAAAFLRRVQQLLGADGGLLIGVDLHKADTRLNAAYNDARGVTAQFNLNLLKRLNRELDADFDPAEFRHLAFYNEEQQRVEMHLVSDRRQSVRCDDHQLEFMPGESIHTENSYKYTVEGFADLAAAAGLALQQSWIDRESLFSVQYFEPIA